MTENLLVSVIVPIYKVEKYLCECVDSIISQSYSNLEIILVDDGSPDRCPEICDEYAKQDCRMKVIHKPNSGLSDARNVGLTNSSGDYVIFIDSDDFWNDINDMNYLVGKIYEYDFPDFIGFNTYNYYPNGSKISWRKYKKDITDEYAKENIIINLIKTGEFPVSAWSKILKRSFLISNNISFIKGIECEDIPWFLDVLEKSNRFRYVDRYIYCYRKQRVNSISSHFSRTKYNNVFLIIQNAITKIKKSEYSTTAKEALLSFCAYYYCILLAEIRNYDRQSRKIEFEKLKKLEWLFDYDIHPKVKKVKFIHLFLGLGLTSVLCNFYSKYIHKQ